MLPSSDTPSTLRSAGLVRPERIDRGVVLAAAVRRSGLRWLTALLDSHPGSLCRDEPFERSLLRRPEIRGAPAAKNRHDIQRRPRSAHRRMDQRHAAHPAGTLFQEAVRGSEAGAAMVVLGARPLVRSVPERIHRRQLSGRKSAL